MASMSSHHLRIENICFLWVGNSILAEKLTPIIGLFRILIRYQSSLYSSCSKEYPFIAIIRISK